MKVSISGYCNVKEKFFPYFDYIAFKLHFIPNSFHINCTYSQDEYLYNQKQIYIRYSLLHKFHSKILKHNQHSNSKIQIPQFPPKVLFKSETILNKRMQQLETYLNNLLSITNNIPLQKYIRNFFIKYIKSPVYNDLKNYLNINNTENNNNNNNSKEENYDSSNNNIENDNENSVSSSNSNDSVYSLLKALNEFPKNICEHISTFEKKNDNSLFTITDKQLIDKEDIYALFFGSEENGYKGLVYYIGQYNTNMYGALSCLSLISRLVDCEYNSNYDLYSKIFRLGTKNKIESMQLENFLGISNQNIKFTCFTIIKCLCDDDHFTEAFWFMNNKSYYEQYFHWMNN